MKINAFIGFLITNTVFTCHNLELYIFNFCDFFLKLKHYLFCTYEGFALMYMCAPCACLVPTETRKGSQTPWNWTSRFGGNQTLVLWDSQCS